MRRAAEALEPHAVLAVAGGVAIGCEAARIDTGSTAWVLVGAAAAFTAMVLAWHEQDRLRLLPLAGIALAFQLIWIWANETLRAQIQAIVVA